MKEVQKHPLVGLILGCLLAAAIAALVISQRKYPVREAPVMNTNAEPSKLVLQLTNQTFLALGNAIVAKVDEAYWDVLTNAFPTNLVTRDLFFWTGKTPGKRP